MPIFLSTCFYKSSEEHFSNWPRCTKKPNSPHAMIGKEESDDETRVLIQSRFELRSTAFASVICGGMNV